MDRGSEGMVGGGKQEMKKSTGPRPASSERRNTHFPPVLNTDAQLIHLYSQTFYFELLYIPKLNHGGPSVFSQHITVDGVSRCYPDSECEWAT